MSLKNFATAFILFYFSVIHPSVRPSMYLLTKCQHNANNNAIDNAKWNTEQKRETLCENFGPP